MKFFKIGSLVFAVLMVASCTNLDLDLQDNPNAVTPDNAGLEFLFNSVQINFADATWEAYDEPAGIVRQLAMTGGNVYDNNDSPNNFNFLWTETYANILPDIEAVLALLEGQTGVEFATGVSKTLKAYSMMTLVDLFGDVPFSDALKGSDSQNPTLDDDAAVYASALALLNEAKAHFATGEGPGSLTDIFYGGDAGQWLKAVNSLIIRYNVTTKLAGGSGSAVASAAADAIQEWSDDFDFQYGSNRENPDARNPYYTIDYEGDADYYQSNYFMWSLLEEKGLEDPRLRYFFYRPDCDTTDEDNFALDCPGIPRPVHYTGPYPWCIACECGYWGRDHGNNDGIPPDGFKRTTFGVYPVGGSFDADDCAELNGNGTNGALGAGILPIASAATTDFLRAEAALTMGSGEDARELLESGMRNSIEKVRDFGSGQADAAFVPSDDDISTYVNIVLNAFDGADAAGQLDIVIKEYHIASFGNGLDAYNNYRRTGYPSNMQPTRDPQSGEFPRLFFYPSDHVALNSNGNQRALGQQVFWDTNPANPNWVD
ncbi:MAG: SusD/RagB family nutrient-binding outer membrane lipoprotein [Saprospiraceae bacterium]|nr:SusD/RagB family nutrient-binding outer membrane lipoprotein [Saprospiraceae bacterium]